MLTLTTTKSQSTILYLVYIFYLVLWKSGLPQRFCSRLLRRVDQQQRFERGWRRALAHVRPRSQEDGLLSGLQELRQEDEVQRRIQGQSSLLLLPR